MSVRWSPSTGHFYDSDIHGDAVPEDAVAVTSRQHAALVDGRLHGRVIALNERGKPRLVDAPRSAVTLDEAIVAIKREARRRILAIASLEKQSNDNAAMALGVAPEARDRRRQIDAIRAASNAIEATITASPAATLSTFNVGDAALWPAKDS